MYFLGDTHGDFAIISKLIRQYGILNDTIIQVGDFGTDSYTASNLNTLVSKLNYLLATYGIHMYVIRGNHDNPTYFTQYSPLNDSNITMVPDYSILNIEGKKLLLAGGAISVNRVNKQVNGLAYFKDEVFVYDKDKLRQQDLSNLWAVVTHAAPTIAPPFEFNDVVWSHQKNDQGLLVELDKERKEIDKLLNYTLANSAPKFWIYGHYHQTYTKRRKGIYFVGLNINQVVDEGYLLSME